MCIGSGFISDCQNAIGEHIFSCTYSLTATALVVRYFTGLFPQPKCRMSPGVQVSQPIVYVTQTTDGVTAQVFGSRSLWRVTISTLMDSRGGSGMIQWGPRHTTLHHISTPAEIALSKSLRLSPLRSALERICGAPLFFS